jgi:hypothetical protein
MEDSFSEARSNDIVEREPRIIERCLVCVQRNAARILNDNGLRDCVGNPAKLAFIFAPAIFPSPTASPPDGTQLASPSHATLQEKGLCTHAIVC